MLPKSRKSRTVPHRQKYSSVLLSWAYSLILVPVSVLIFLYYFNQEKINGREPAPKLRPPNPEISLPASSSILHTFQHGALCSDTAVCSEIGRDILHKGGNAVDIALATLLCNGITTMQSLGLGGGFIMNIFIKSQNRAYTLNAREVAPLNTKLDKSSMEDSLSIAVPGEVLGYWEIHKKFATISWNELFKPSIKICEEGFILSKHMFDSLSLNLRIKNDFHLRKTFVNEVTNEFYPIGSLIKPSQQLCNTYRLLAENDGNDYYNGSVAKMIIEDLKEMKSDITIDDLKQYEVEWYDSIPITLDNKDIMYVVPPVGSGVLVGLIINILQEYDMEKIDLLNTYDATLFYHRFLEACKHAFAKRSELGDMKFNDIKALLKNLTSKNYAFNIRQKIYDDKTFNISYYDAKFWSENEHGTSHMSVLSSNGDAVSVTSSINFYFGSGHSGRRSGIVFNNGMDDFSIPGINNYFDIPASKSNFIKPKKRAMSSMCPTIITDSMGNVKLVIGAAGGSKIISIVAWVIAKILWFNYDIKKAIDQPRIHHQLFPNEVYYEYGVIKNILKGLEEKEHKLLRFQGRTAMCGIMRNNSIIYANVDFRKEGKVCGF